jgi:hypothetical protein
MRMLTGAVITALSGVTMLALSMSAASAFPLSGLPLAQPGASAQIDKVYYRRAYRGRRYGYGGAAVVGGVAAGLAVGAAVAAPHCWINQWGNRVCN